MDLYPFVTVLTLIVVITSVFGHQNFRLQNKLNEVNRKLLKVTPMVRVVIKTRSSGACKHVIQLVPHLLYITPDHGLNYNVVHAKEFDDEDAARTYVINVLEFQLSPTKT